MKNTKTRGKGGAASTPTTTESKPAHPYGLPGDTPTQSAKNLQKQAVENAHHSRWTRKEVELLVQKRKSDSMSFAAIARKHFPGRSTASCKRRFARLKWNDGDPVLPIEDDAVPSGDGLDNSSIPVALAAPPASVTVMPASVVRLFPKISEKVREGAAPYFTMLQQDDFASYRQVIDDWRAGTEWRAANHITRRRDPNPLPLATVSTLSWNDYLSSVDVPLGRFRTDWKVKSQTFAYLADRAWTEEEQREYREASPR